MYEATGRYVRLASWHTLKMLVVKFKFRGSYPVYVPLTELTDARPAVTGNVQPSPSCLQVFPVSHCSVICACPILVPIYC
jgi:hypothetical protein